MSLYYVQSHAIIEETFREAPPGDLIPTRLVTNKACFRTVNNSGGQALKKAIFIDDFLTSEIIDTSESKYNPNDVGGVTTPTRSKL